MGGSIDYTFVCMNCGEKLQLTVDDAFFQLLDVQQALLGSEDPLMYKLSSAWELLGGWVYVRNQDELQLVEPGCLVEAQARCHECWLKSQRGMRPAGANRNVIALATQLRRVHGPARYFPA